MRTNRVERIRVSLGRLVVPPFDCAWLSDPDSKLNNERGCIVFEVSGETDATIILKEKPGSRRLQSTEGDSRYVIIFGSHRNSLLSIERNEHKQAAVRESWTQISPDCFRKFWICYLSGVMYIGTGDPSSSYQYKWEDANPLHGIHSVGLSAWDKHCTFRNVHVLPSVPLLELNRMVPSLFDISASLLMEHLNLQSACAMLLMLDRLELPDLSEVWKRVVTVLAREFEVFFRECRDVFCHLSKDAVSALLRSPELSLDEDAIFEAVVEWMYYGQSVNPQRQIRTPEDIQSVIKWIRFATIETEELQSMLSIALSMDSAALCCAIQDALVVQSSAPKLLADGSVTNGREVSQTQSEVDLFWRRGVRDGIQLQYCFDGDKKGIINHLAHDCGRKPWKNPMSNKKLLVKASSPSSRSTRPKAKKGTYLTLC